MDIKEVSITKLGELDSALDQILNDLNVRVIPNQIRNGDIWDYIRVEIWEDSGRIIFFPASTKTDFRVDVTTSFIYCEELKNKVDALDASQLHDEEYDKSLIKIVHMVSYCVLDYLDGKLKFQLKCFNQDGHQLGT